MELVFTPLPPPSTPLFSTLLFSSLVRRLPPTPCTINTKPIPWCQNFPQTRGSKVQGQEDAQKFARVVEGARILHPELSEEQMGERFSVQNKTLCGAGSSVSGTHHGPAQIQVHALVDLELLPGPHLRSATRSEGGAGSKAQVVGIKFGQQQGVLRKAKRSRSGRPPSSLSGGSCASS